MLFTAARRAAPPIASAASATQPFGPALSQAESTDGILATLSLGEVLCAKLAIITTPQTETEKLFRKKIEYPVLLVIIISPKLRNRRAEKLLDERPTGRKAAPQITLMNRCLAIRPLPSLPAIC
jgi:hypothetical protein